MKPFYRAPSVPRLCAELGVSTDDAQCIRNLLHGDDPRNVHQSVKNVDVILNAVSEMIGDGVECIETSEYIDEYYRYTALIYVNRGDTYTTTLCYETATDRFMLTSYGDWCEKHYRQIAGL